MTILLIHFLTTMSFVINEIICTFSFLARLELLAIKKAMLNLRVVFKNMYTQMQLQCVNTYLIMYNFYIWQRSMMS